MRNYFRSIFIVLFLFAICSNTVFADDNCPNCETIVKKYSNLKIKEIELLTDKPIYQIVTQDNKIIYVDGDKYFFIGAVINSLTQANVTLEKMDKLLNVKFNDFALDKAILFKGTGKNTKKILAFVDIEEIPSKTFLDDVSNIQNDIDVYVYLYPINHATDKKLMSKNEHIWCSNNKVDVLKRTIKGENIVNYISCKTPVLDIVEIGKKIGVGMIPTIYLSNNKILRGYGGVASINNSFEK